MRGEDSTMTELLISAPETPPHARGRREDAHDIERAIRNTPACAGKTGCDGTRSTTHQGNTPACAGKTGRRLRLRRPRWKHPRMRGEDVIWRFRSSRSLETPPHARGRQLLNLKSLTQIRNTPACAGKTNRRHAKRRQGRKHPRMRGEDLAKTLMYSTLRETPPHARGRLDKAKDWAGRCRNTPACAGKTDKSVFLLLGKWKHPRMRGED